MLASKPSKESESAKINLSNYRKIDKFDYYDLNDKSIDLTTNKQGVYFSKMSTNTYKPIFSSDPLQKN